MKRDPFATLAGLDQRLFDQPASKVTKQRLNETTRERKNVVTDVASPAATSERTIEHSIEPAPETTFEPALEQTTERASEATRTPASTLRGRLHTARRVERHSHDLFRDQVRWMNRAKLELEERYGSRLTSNAMAQLAIDLLWDDFERNGERSQLFRVLVLGRSWPKPQGATTEERR